METGMTAPQEGTMLPLFALPDDSGRMVDIGEFRQSRNLVVCFCRTTSSEDVVQLLREIGRAASGVTAEEGVALVVVPGTSDEARNVRKMFDLPFPVLADEQGKVLRQSCPEDVALYVTDRFREIFLALHGADAVVPAQFIVDRLAFIERQCPE